MSNRPNPRPQQRRAATAAADRTSTTPASKQRTTYLIAAAVGAVIVCIVLAVVISSRSGTPTAVSADAAKTGLTTVPSGTLSFGTVTVDGAPLPELPETGGADPAIGASVPAITGQQFDGSAITIPASGKPKVVMFVAHWCPHCQKEVPVITSYLNSKGLPAGVDLFAVATSTSDQRPNFPPGEWLKKDGWPVPTLVDNKEFAAAAAYGIGGFPYFAIVDASGKVVVRTSGEKSVEQFQAMIDAARTGTAPAAGAV